MIDFQLVVQHRAAGVLTSTNFNLDALGAGKNHMPATTTTISPRTFPFAS
jgi:hypothetical protein